MSDVNIEYTDSGFGETIRIRRVRRLVPFAARYEVMVIVPSDGWTPAGALRTRKPLALLAGPLRPDAARRYLREADRRYRAGDERWVTIEVRSRW